jgi:hypothetical protein
MEYDNPLQGCGRAGGNNGGDGCQKATRPVETGTNIGVCVLIFHNKSGPKLVKNLISDHFYAQILFSYL